MSIDNWVSVKDRLPDREGMYKVKRMYSDIEEYAEYTPIGFTNYQGYAVTHWKPKIREDVFGWFESALSRVPDHDPGLNTICIICGNKLDAPMKTISLMKDGDSRSYFYRTHKKCYEEADENEICRIESALIDL